ncbi:multimerin-2a [Halichoeres trimaculatus]|uniref:multimerin-2a n=1 Tax=Halichoeres trimaculatus TaxID=147232 RepID=UPI003D9DFC02
MWLKANMAAVGELVLVLGLLVSAHCEVRARDPEVEEEEEEFGGRAAAGGGGAAFPSHLKELPPGATEKPPGGDKGSIPGRMGNWCSFVQERVVTTAAMSGTETYVVRSQNRCPSKEPNCQVVMYKLSTRPVYKQEQRVVTALLWRCCPGHGGHTCEDRVPGAQLNPEKSDPIEVSKLIKTEPHHSGVQAKLQLQHGDPDQVQNDHQVPLSSLYGTGYADNQHNTSRHTLNPGHADNLHDASQQAANTHNQYLHHSHHGSHHGSHHRHGVQQGRHVTGDVDDAHLTYQEAPAVLPVPHMMALVMSQLQPVFASFNRSLDYLSQQVGDLARDVAQLKSSQLEAELQAELQAQPPEVSELVTAADERLDTRLDETLQQITEVRRQMESHRMDMENRLHSQHAMLHYNLTVFKTDIDMKLKRHQKMLQVSLQAMNSTLAELKLNQDQLEGHLSPPTMPPLRPLQPSDTGLWEAIERLDNMVVNNTVKVDGLMEDLEVTSGDVQQLRRDFKDLGKQINLTARTSQIQFMETGLEVEAAREVVLRRVNELAGNLSLQGGTLHEMEMDLDYLYAIFYKRNSSTDCECKGLTATLALLEKRVTNVTELAYENRLALDESNEAGAGQWGGSSDWEPAVGSLQQDLQQVQETLTSEQTRTSTLEQSLRQLSSTVTVGLAKVSGLESVDSKMAEEMKHLSGSFNSLLKDAIRHSDVLELLLGEEVLEFLEWPVQDQEAHSIPALKEQLGLLQEQLRGHNLSITSLLGNKPESREEVPSADQPLSSSHHLPEDWLPGNRRRSVSGVPARERQIIMHPQGRHPEHGVDGSDLWNLEKAVEELRQKVLLLEEQRNATTVRAAPPSGEEAELQVEVLRLKRGLEEHLRVFKSVFSNADVLLGSDATLELDKLWEQVKNKDRKKEKKRGGGREAGRGGNHRSRRETSGVVPVLDSESEGPLLLMAGSAVRVSDRIIHFKASVNRGQFYSDSGTFTAPVDGTYLFVLTLNLRPGPAYMVLRRASGGTMVSLYQQEVKEAGLVTGVSLVLLSEGEEVWLQLHEGHFTESVDNVLYTMLLHQTT